jgi:hypothetical protein
MRDLPRREGICSLVTANLSRVERSVKEAVKGSKVAEDVVEVVTSE